MHNLAGTLYAQGEMTGARKLQEQVLEAMVRLLGKEHPNTLTAMNNLAQTLKAQGSSASAKKPAKHVAEPHGQVKTGTKEPEHRESGTGPK
jgi:hypothetical protein